MNSFLPFTVTTLTTFILSCGESNGSTCSSCDMGRRSDAGAASIANNTNEHSTGGASAVDASGTAPHPLSNKTFLLQIESSHWTSPPNGFPFSQVFPPLLIQFGQGNATAMPFTLGSAKDGAQNPCGPTVVGTGSAEPLSVGPVDLPLHLVHPDPSKMLAVNATLQGFSASDLLGAQTTAAQGTLSVRLDVRDVFRLITQLNSNMSPETPDVVCDAFQDVAAQGGSGCEPCQDGRPYCMLLAAHELSAMETLIEVNSIGTDVWATNPACAATP